MEENSIKLKRIIDRFDKYMIIKNLNDNKVTCDLGVSIGTIGKSRKTGRDLSSKVVELILNFYIDINKIWLLTGEGEMLKHNFFIDNSLKGDGSIRVAGNSKGNIIAGSNIRAGLNDKRNKEQQECLLCKAKDNLIQSLEMQLIARNELLQDKEKQLQAKDEQLQAKDKIINSLIDKIK